MLFIKITICVFCLIGIISLIFFLFDWIKEFTVWQSRIGIGKFSNTNDWKNSITERGIKWLKHSPNIPKNDNKRLVLWDIIKGEHKNSSIQSWQTAGLLLGMNSTNHRIEKEDILKIINTYNNTSNIDRALLAYALIQTNRINNNCIQDIDKFAESTINLILDTKSNNTTVPYRKSIPEIRFVDTLGLICPFIVAYALNKKEQTLIYLAQQQLQEYKSWFHKDLFLPPHAYNTHTNSPIGVYDWGRGIGWYIIAIIECHRILLENEIDSKNIFFQYIKNSILELADIVLKYQKDSGGFSLFITDKNGLYESSATVLCGLLFEETFCITKDLKYKEATYKTITALMSVTKRNGAIDLCQGDTKGAGFYSTHLGVMPFVQGLGILLANRYDTHA